MCDDKTLRIELEHVKKCADQNNRALYGSNGDTGLLSDVADLKKTVDRIATNDLPHMKEDIMDELSKLQEKAVQWPSLGKGLVAPILIAVITALLVTGLHRIFFP